MAFPATVTRQRTVSSVVAMNLYGIFFILLAPLLPALVALTVHPVLDLRDAWTDRGLARTEHRPASAPTDRRLGG
jgi:hypothetical protein